MAMCIRSSSISSSFLPHHGFSSLKWHLWLLGDYLFGNETEARAYAEAAGWDTQDVSFIATRLSLVPMAGGKPYRKVVITQGAEPTVVACRGEIKSYPVPPLPKEMP